MKTVERARGDERQHNRRSELFEQQIETRFSAIILKPILESYVSICENQLIPIVCVGFIPLHTLTFVTTRKWSLNQTAVKLSLLFVRVLGFEYKTVGGQGTSKLLYKLCDLVGSNVMLHCCG